MSSFSGYKTTAFKETKKFFVLDPATGSPSFVQGSDLVSYILPSLNSVLAETTTDAAVNADYEVGKVVQTTGESAPGDGNPGLFLVVAAGTGGIPMLNGNELLVLEGANTALGISYDNTSSGLAAENVQAALDENAGDIDKRTIFVGSVAEGISGLLVADETEISVTGWHPDSEIGGGEFVFRAGIAKSQHNGGSIISPTVPAVSAQAGATDADKRDNYLDAVGETDPSGTGVFVKRVGCQVDITEYGAFRDKVRDDYGAYAKTQEIHGQITANDGDFLIKITDAALPVVNGRIISGNGALYFENTGMTRRNAIKLGTNSEIKDISIYPFNTDATFTDNTSLTQVDADPLASFNYNSQIIALGMADDTKASRVKVFQCWRGIDGDSSTNVSVKDCQIIQMGVWSTQFFDTRNVDFDNNVVMYGGSSGGAAFSSGKKLRITNNRIKTVGTGINPGGSGTAGFNVEDLVITGNTVIARDCINMENGAVRFNVSGNHVMILKDYDLPGTNGTGITNTSQSGGVFGGDCGDGTISANRIDTYDAEYAFGIALGSSASDAEITERWAVTGNSIRGAQIGIELRSGNSANYARDITVSGNTIFSGNRGIRISNVERANISGNTIKTSASTTLSNYYGISMSGYRNVTASDNTFIGFGYAFNLASDGVNNSTCRLLDNINLPNDNDASAPLGFLQTDGNDQFTRYFCNNITDVVTDTANRITLRSTSVYYNPGSPISLELEGWGQIRTGEIASVRFNGSVTVKDAGPIVTKDRLDVVPPADGVMMFVKDNSIFREINRNF